MLIVCTLLAYLFVMTESRISRKNQATDSRIVGGNEVAGASIYPFFVSWDGDCGGTLIHRDIVLTAAQCNHISSNVVTINAHNYENALDNVYSSGSSEVIRKIVGREIHPLYNENTYEYDFMLLKLDQPITTGSYIQPLKINRNTKIPYGDQRLKAIGLGRLTDGGAYPDNLNEVIVHAKTDDTCKEPYPIFNSDVMFCAGSLYNEGGLDSCHGDSGGPIFTLNTDGTPNKLVGVISWGVGCGSGQYPGVYAEISSVQFWIDEIIFQISNVDDPFYEEPTSEPTSEPTFYSQIVILPPQQSPTPLPISQLTQQPTMPSASQPSPQPAPNPTQHPTYHPTQLPTYGPTPEPTYEPTAPPTEEPTEEPTDQPSEAPSIQPTTFPPSQKPTIANDLTTEDRPFVEFFKGLEMTLRGFGKSKYRRRQLQYNHSASNPILDESSISLWETTTEQYIQKFYESELWANEIKSLTTDIKVTSQEILETGDDIKLTFDQALSYRSAQTVSLRIAEVANDLLTLPFVTDPRRRTYVYMLRTAGENANNDVFANLYYAIITPLRLDNAMDDNGVSAIQINDPNDDNAAVSDAHDFFSTTNVIIGFASICGVLLLVIAVGALCFINIKRRQYVANSKSTKGEGDILFRVPTVINDGDSLMHITEQWKPTSRQPINTECTTRIKDKHHDAVVHDRDRKYLHNDSGNDSLSTFTPESNFNEVDDEYSTLSDIESTAFEEPRRKPYLVM